LPFPHLKISEIRHPGKLPQGKEHSISKTNEKNIENKMGIQLDIVF
tara:strand:- start:961 stop:1098 length:138 start_codon:yes stop_codon:yes gene_type:complete